MLHLQPALMHLQKALYSTSCVDDLSSFARARWHLQKYISYWLPLKEPEKCASSFSADASFIKRVAGAVARGWQLVVEQITTGAAEAAAAAVTASADNSEVLLDSVLLGYAALQGLSDELVLCLNKHAPPGKETGVAVAVAKQITASGRYSISSCCPPFWTSMHSGCAANGCAVNSLSLKPSRSALQVSLGKYGRTGGLILTSADISKYSITTMSAVVRQRSTSSGTL